jgi:integrase/recombinase XerD
VAGMDTTSADLALLEPNTGTLKLAVAAYLARYKGLSRAHAESDLRSYLHWCLDHRLDPLQAQRPHIENSDDLCRGASGRR